MTQLNVYMFCRGVGLGLPASLKLSAKVLRAINRYHDVAEHVKSRRWVQRLIGHRK